MLKAVVQKGAAKQIGTIMEKMPKKKLQAKIKQEKRADGMVRVGSTVPTFAEIGALWHGEDASW